MSVSVVISTYNNPVGLRMCLLGMLSQTVLPDQIIIADDGSRRSNYSFLNEKLFSSLPIDIVWHPDHGWQKNTILNLAVRHCRGNYLIFSDGDTIPRKDFVESHLNNARPKTFLSGAGIDVPKHVHKTFTDVKSWKTWYSDYLSSLTHGPRHISIPSVFNPASGKSH